jgi:hypothetical protein
VSLAALACASPALSQAVSDDIVDATVGHWLIASSDGAPGCRVKLEKDQAIGGRALTVEKPCALPWRDLLAAWDFSEGGIVFRDATRKSLITFEEQEGGPWRTPLDKSPVVYFVQEPGDMDHIPTEREVAGDWVLTDSKGKKLCAISFLNRLAKGYEDAKAIGLSKDCSSAVRKTGASAWEISDIQLVVIGGEEWIYTMMPDGTGGFTSDDGRFKLVRKQL